MHEKQVPIPQGKYIPANRYGALIYSAGMTPRQNGQLILTGQVSAAKPLEYYQEAVHIAAQNALIAVQSLVLPQEKIAKIITMTVYINAETGYTQHAKLADFASDYLCQELGEAGVVSRAAIGVASLPGNAPVEIQIIAAVE